MFEYCFQIFHAGCGQCVDENVGLTASCEEPLPPQTSNPCTRQNIIDSECSLYAKDQSTYRTEGRHNPLIRDSQGPFKVEVNNLNDLMMTVLNRMFDQVVSPP